MNRIEKLKNRGEAKFLSAWLGFILAFGAAVSYAAPADSGRAFKLELFGGWNSLNPSDFNLITAADKTIQDTFFDQFYNSVYKNYSKKFEKNGDLLPLRNAFPLGIRAAWQFHPHWTLTFGLEYLSRTKISTVAYAYSIFYNSSLYIYDKKDFPDYRIGVSAWTALVGLRYETPLFRTMTIGAYIGGGMAWLHCRQSKEWHWQYSIQDYSYSGSQEPVVTFDQSGKIEELGSGNGIAAEAGLRLGWRCSSRWTLFCEAGFTFRRSGDISGTGKEKIGAEENNWDGIWYVAKEHISAYWKPGDIEYPSNRPETIVTDKYRTFRLDLSGFQLRAGISLSI